MGEEEPDKKFQDAKRRVEKAKKNRAERLEKVFDLVEINNLDGIVSLIAAEGWRISPLDDSDRRRFGRLDDDDDWFGYCKYHSILVGLSDIISDHISGDKEQLGPILGELFVGNGHDPDDFEADLDKAMNILEKWIVESDEDGR